MADVVLVYPKSSYIEAAMLHFYPPLALLNAVVFVAQSFTVRIIDQRVDRDWRKHLLEELATKPLCVGVSSLTGEQITGALEVSRIVRQHGGVPVVWGGVHASILPAETLAHPLVDFVVEGEGEIAFLKLVEALRDKSPLAAVPGLWYLEGGKPLHNPCPELVDLATLPELPYHLLDMRHYIVDFGGEPMFAMESSRGCPNHCTFCFVQKTTSQRLWRALPAELTVERIQKAHRDYGVRGIELLDLESFINPERLKLFCELLIKADLGLFWNACARVNDILRLDREGLALLERSGLRRLALGVESGSPRILKMIRKGITVDQVRDVSTRLAATKIPPVWSFIAGFPTETSEELRLTTELIVHLLRENPTAKSSILHCFRPLPGTELYDTCVEMGLKRPQSLEEWATYEMGKIDFPWISKEMQHRIAALNFLSLFIDKKYVEVDSPAVRLFGQVYGPLARYRFKNEDFRWFLEPGLKQAFLALRRWS